MSEELTTVRVEIVRGSECVAFEQSGEFTEEYAAAIAYDLGEALSYYYDSIAPDDEEIGDLLAGSISGGFGPTHVKIGPGSLTITDPKSFGEQIANRARQVVTGSRNPNL